MDLTTEKGFEEMSCKDHEEKAEAHVSYVATPGYSSFKVTDGIYNGTTATEGTYAPKGSYAMSGGKMYELNKDTRIKGFRGWIELPYSIFDEEQQLAHFSINGVVDIDDPIEELIPGDDPQDGGEEQVTDGIASRKVGTRAGQLPHGLYIVGGKKLLVK